MKQHTLWMIDVSGGVLLTAILSAAAWFAGLKPDTATQRMRELTVRVDQLQVDQSALRTIFEREAAEHRRLTDKADAVGRLPARSPIERDLQTITGLASDNRIKLVEVTPLPAVDYPNVRELRYRVKTTGTHADHLRFFSDFEQCSFWADITYLKFEQTINEMIRQGSTRNAELTLSFFSAAQ